MAGEAEAPSVKTLKNALPSTPTNDFWDRLNELPPFGVKIWDGFLFAVVSIRVGIMVLLTAFTTFLCSPAVLNLSWHTSMDIVSVGVVFPVIFAVQAAYNQRSEAIAHLNEMKGRLMYLYFQAKSYDVKFDTSLGQTIQELISDLGVDIIKTSATNSHAHKSYDALAVAMETLSAASIPPPLVKGMIAAVQSLLVNLEGVRAVRDNETPKGLRKFAIFLIVVSPVVLAPYWTTFCKDTRGGSLNQIYTLGADGALIPVSAANFQINQIVPFSIKAEDGQAGAKEPGEIFGPDIEHPFGCLAGYMIGLLYVLITFSILRVSESLEDPFDGMGEDDISWTVFARFLDQVHVYGKDGINLRAGTSRKQD